jgi:hypothetical protein
MKHENIKNLGNEKFRRLTGIKRTTFDKMVIIVKEANRKKKAKGGRRNKLQEEDMVLMTLEYLREYRTYFHIGQSYGLSESSAFKTIRWVEDTLIKHSDFALPGKKALLKSDTEYETILIDVTESPIERPKKNKDTFTPARKNDIH